MALATVRRVTAEPLSRAHPPAGIVRALVGDAASETLALAAAVPFIFLHATYQPSVSLGVGSTSIDATLADAAIACVLVAATLRSRREGWWPLVRARLVLGLAAAFLVVCAVSLATPSLLGEDYDLTRHAISLAKFAWYATLLPATVLLVRSTVDLVPVVRAFIAWSVAATSWALLQFLGIVAEFEGKRPGQREPSFVGIHDLAALSGRRPGRRLDRGRARRRRAGGETLVARGARDGGLRRRPLGSDDRRARPLARARRNSSRSPRRRRPGRPPCARARRHHAARHGRDRHHAGLDDRAVRGVHRDPRPGHGHRGRELRAPHAARVHRRPHLARPAGDRRRLAGLERGVGVPAVPRRRARALPERARPGLPLSGAPVGDPDALPPGRRRPRRRRDRAPPRPRRRGRDGRNPRAALVPGRARRPRLAVRRRRRVDRHRARRRAAAGGADVDRVRAGDRA